MNWYKLAKKIAVAQQGEWWIDDSGNAFFADADIGDYNHAVLAFEAALGVNLEDSSAPEIIVFEPLSPEAINWLREQEADETAIEYFKDGADPRDYAVDLMGWKRVQDNNVETHTLSPHDMDVIASGLWEAYGEPAENMAFNIDVHSSKSYSGVPFAVLSSRDISELRNYQFGAAF